MNEELNKYYEYLKGAGADVPDSFDSFSNTLSDEGNRETYYNYLRNEGYDTPETFESFNSTLFGTVKKKDDTQVSQPSLDESPEPLEEAENDQGLEGPLALENPWDKTLETANMQPPEVQPQWQEALPDGSMTEGMEVPEVSMDDVGKIESGPIGPDNPYRPDLKGFVLAENQIKSRLNNDKIKPWMFSGKNDPGSDVTPSGNPAYEGTTEQELPRDLSWEDLAEQVENAEGQDVKAGMDKYLNYEGRQMLEYVLQKRADDRMRVRNMLIEHDEDVLLPIEGTAGESDGVELYDLNTFGMTKVTKADIKSYLDGSAKRLFGEESLDDLPEDQKKFILRSFAEKYSDRETVETMFKDSGMDFDVSRLQHIYGAFTKGAYGMLEGSAKQTMRALDPEDGYINTIRKFVFGEPDMHPLAEQRYWEDKNIALNKDFSALEKKQLGWIGAYKSNPKYQDSFLSNTIPSALGSAVGIVAGGGGTPLGMGIIGSGAGGDMQATAAFQKGADLDAAFKAQVVGMGIGASEAFPFINIFNRFSSGAKGSILKRIAMSSGEEGLQEIFAGAMNNWTAQQLYDEKQRIIDDKTLEEGAAGAIVGSLFAGAGALVEGRQKNKQPKLTEEQSREKQANLRKLYEDANPEKVAKEQEAEQAKLKKLYESAQPKEEATTEEGPQAKIPVSPQPTNEVTDVVEPINQEENAGLPEDQKPEEEIIEAQKDEAQIEPTETVDNTEEVVEEVVEEEAAEPKFDVQEGESLGELTSRKKTKTATAKRIKKLKKDHAVFSTKKHTIVRDRDGLHVIKNKENAPEDRTEKVYREVVKQYIAENFESMENADEIVEVAMVWDANRPLRKGAGRADMGVDDVIASEIGGMSRADFARYGDPNAITEQMAKAYGMDEKADGIDADIEVASASNFGGRDDAITPEDVVDFMIRFPGGPKDFRAHAKKASAEAGFGIDLDARDEAARKFKELTGLDIGESITNQIFTEDAKRIQRDPIEEAKKSAADELGQADAALAEEAARQEAFEQKAKEASTVKGEGKPEVNKSARDYKSSEGTRDTSRSRERQYLNRALEDPMTPKKVKDRLSTRKREYTQQENEETRDIALAAIAAMRRAGNTFSEIFDIAATDGILPNLLDRMAIAIVVRNNVQNSDPGLASAIDTWIDQKSRDAGQAIQILDAVMPESLVRRERNRIVDNQKFKLERKKGKSGKTLDAELDQVIEEVKTKKADVEQAFESVQGKIPGLGDPEIIADPGAQKRVQKSDARKKKIKEGKKKVNEGLKLLKGLPPTANMTLSGLTPYQVKGLRLIGQGLIEQGYYRFAEWKAKLAAALKGYSLDMDRVAVELWNDTSLGPRNLSADAMDERRDEAVEELASKIVARAKDKAPKEKDLLDIIVSELYGKAAEVIPTEKRKKQSPSEIVAEMIRNKDVAEDVWAAARDRVKAKIQENPKYTEDQKLDMEARLDDYFKLVSDVPFGHTRARQAIREGARDIGAEIKDIAIQHYTKAEASRTTLAQKLVARVGLTGQAALDLQQAFVDELRAMNAEQQKKILERQLGPAVTPKAKKRHKRIVERAVDQINMGALNDTRFKGLFGEKYGFAEINPEVEAELLEIVRLINLVDGGEYKRRKMAEFTNILDRLDNQHTAYHTMQALTEHFFVSILSGVTTLLRAGTGAAMTQTANVAANMVSHMARDIVKGRNPMAIVGRGMQTYWRGSKKGAPFYRGILRTGYSELESTGDQGNYSPLREVINTPFSETIRQIKNAKNNKKKAKAAGNLVYKTLFQPMTMVFRNLIALDAIFHYGQKEYFTMVEEHNKLLAEGVFDKRDTAFWTEIHKRMVEGKNFRDQAEIQVDEELQILEQAGEKQPPEYRKKRITEIIESLRDEDIQNYARQKALEGTLTNKPKYSLGSIVYENLAKATTITKDTNVVIAISKTILKSALAILRVPTNHVNMWLDYTPLGLVRAMYQLTPEDKASETMRSDERMEKIMKVAFGMGVYSILIKSLFDFNDDDELVLKKNPWIEFSAAGWQKNRGYLYDKANSKDFKDYSLRVRKPDGSYSEWLSYRDMPLGFIFASLGYMSDAIKYNQREDKPKLTDAEEFLSFYFQKGMMSPIFMVREQNYMQGLDQLLTVFSEQGTIDAAMGFITKPVTAMMPNLYKQVGKSTRAIQGKQAPRAAKYKDDFLLALKDEMYKNIPFMDQYITDKQHDQLGYPIDVKFEVPYTPDSFFNYAKKIADSQNTPEKKGWELVYKYPEVTLGDYISIRSMKINGKDVDITREDKIWFEKTAADMFRQRLEGRYSKLDRLGPEQLQKQINNIKNDVRKYTRALLYKKKKSDIK